MYKKLLIIMLAIVLLGTLSGCQGDIDEVGSMEEEVGQEEVTEEREYREVVEESEEEEIYYALYLKHRSLPYIFADAYTISKEDLRLQNKSLEVFVMEELINQTAVGDLMNPIPKNTEVLSADREGDTVILNLSQEFVEGMEGTEEDIEATIAMIVNSLTTLSGNNYVRILVEGNAITDLQGVDISGTYEFIEKFYLDK